MGVASSAPTTTDLTPRVSTLEQYRVSDWTYASNLSFTQNALSSTVAAQASRVTTMGTTVDTISAQNALLAGRFDQYNGDYATLTYNITTLSSNIMSLSGSILGAGQLSDLVNTLSGLVNAYDRVAMLSNISNISSILAKTTTDVGTISSSVSVLNTSIVANTAAYGTISATVSNLGLSYALLNTQYSGMSTSVSNLGVNMGIMYSSCISYASAANQSVTNYTTLYSQSISTLSALISTNALYMNASFAQLSLNLSNVVMSISAYVAVLDSKVTTVTAVLPVPKVFTPSAATTVGTLTYGMFVDPRSTSSTYVPSGSIIYSQNANNVQFLMGNAYLSWFTVGYFVRVVNYSSAALTIATTWSRDTSSTNLSDTGATLANGFYQGPGKTLANAVTISAGKAATFMWVGGSTTGPWAVTYSS